MKPLFCASPQGACLSDGGVWYRTWAPVAARVAVQVRSPQNRVIELSRSRDGYFQGLDELGQAGDLYLYQLDNAQSVPDPASRWQPQGVHGPSMVMDPS